MSAHSTHTELKLIGKLILEGDLHCETGLHIGGGKATLSYTDNPVVLTPEGLPFIPGSSFKGRWTCLTLRGR